MVILIVEAWFPAKSAVAAGKKYLEVRAKYPPDKTLSKQVLSAFNAVEDGIHSIAAWTIKEGMADKALRRTAEAMVMYGDIEGYKYKINTYLTLTECMPMIGLSSPDTNL